MFTQWVGFIGKWRLYMCFFLWNIPVYFCYMDFCYNKKMIYFLSLKSTSLYLKNDSIK